MHKLVRDAAWLLVHHLVEGLAVQLVRVFVGEAQERVQLLLQAALWHKMQRCTK